jgi:hypothetical protein
VLTDRRSGLCRLCSTRLVLNGLAPPLACVAGNSGVRSSRESRRTPVPSGGYGQGADRTGEVREPLSDVSLCVNLARWVVMAGWRGWPLRSGRRRSGIFCRSGGHRRPRDTGGTHPGRISYVWNVGTPMGSGHKAVTGKPTVRKAQSPSGKWMTREANAGGRKATGTLGSKASPPLVASDNWPDTGRRARTRKSADAGQVSL